MEKKSTLGSSSKGKECEIEPEAYIPPHRRWREECQIESEVHRQTEQRPGTYIPPYKRREMSAPLVQLPSKLMHLVPKDLTCFCLVPNRNPDSIVLALTNTTGMEFGFGSNVRKRINKVRKLCERGQKTIIHTIHVLAADKTQIRNDEPSVSLVTKTKWDIYKFFLSYPEMMPIVFQAWPYFKNYDETESDPRTKFDTEAKRRLLLQDVVTFTRDALPYFLKPVDAFVKHGVYICSDIGPFICLAIFLASKIPAPHLSLENHLTNQRAISPDKTTFNEVSIPRIQAAFDHEISLDFLSFETYSICKRFCVLEDMGIRYNLGGGIGDYQIIGRSRIGKCSCLRHSRPYGIFRECDLCHPVFLFQVDDRYATFA